MRVALNIRLTLRPLHEPRAWYLPGGEAGGWLCEIARWQTPHASLKLAPVPRSASHVAPRGVLIIPSSSDIHGVSARCLPYGLLGGRLYVPVAARLEPEVDERELQALLDPQYDYVWHPQAGLIAFSAEEMLSVSQLVAVGPSQPQAWSAARPGLAFPGRLLSLAIDAEPTVEQLLQQGREDIGDPSKALDELPRSDREPRPGAWNAAKRQGARAAANVVKWLTDGAASATGGAAWLENWRRWAKERLGQLSAETEAARNREITRLIDLLDKDPDRGLQFALPLTGDAHRGIAPVGGRLGRRSVDLNLANLGGGRPADPWVLPTDRYLELQRRYYELATREQRLGRYRRAAYIWAELLGDFQAAAGALTAGGYWREAAVLYEKRLGQPLEAARCLERGGLWSEAIASYDQQLQHEKAGDLLAQLEQHDEARRRYEAALAVRRAAADVLGSARLLEEKLQSPHDALAELARGWPDSGQAVACLRRVFELAGRLGEHGEAQLWVARLREDPPRNPHTFRGAVESLADAAQKYPDAELRRRAADTSRVLISGALAEATVSDARALVASLGKLAPGDRLLHRDGQRYLDRRRSRQTGSAPTKPTQRKRGEARKIATLQFDPGVCWRSFITCGGVIYAVGYRNERRIVVARGDWSGRCEESRTARWGLPPGAGDLLLCMAPQRDPQLLVHVLGKPPLATRPGFPGGHAFADAAQAGGSPVIAPGTLAVSRSSADRTWTVRVFEGSLWLYCLAATGECLDSFLLDEDIWQIVESLEVPIVLHRGAERTYVGLGTRLLTIAPDRQRQTLEMPRPITQLAGTSPHTVGRVVATFQRGAMVCWEGPELHHVFVAHDVADDPTAGFNRRGLLTVVSRQGGEVYRTANRRAERLANVPPQPDEPLAVLSPPHVKQIGIALAGGTIDVYEVP